MNTEALTLTELQEALDKKKKEQQQQQKQNNNLKKSLQNKQAKKSKQEAYNLAENKLRGLSAWAKFLQSEHGYAFIYYLGLKIDFEVRRLELLRAWEKLDAEKVGKSPLTEGQLINRGRLILKDKDGNKRRHFTTAQVVRALRYIAKAGERSVILEKVA